MSDNMWHTKEEPFLGLQGMGGGASSLMWAGGGDVKYNLFTWGSSAYGQLGLNQGWRNNDPWGPYARSSPTQIPGDWFATYGGNEYNKQFQMGAKDEADTLWTWGSNQYGQLGHNECDDDPHRSNKSSPTQIPGSWQFAGSYVDSAIGLKEDGHLYAWGQGYTGLFGGGAPASNIYNLSSPTQLSSHFDQAGRNWVADQKKWGINYGSFYLINDLDELWAWGSNNYGQLGQNGTLNYNTNYSSPVQIPGSWYSVDSHVRYNSVSAIKTDGTLWYWGYLAQWGSPWVPTEQNSRSSPTLMPGGPYIRASERTNNNGFLVKGTNTMWYHGGSFEYGMRGDGTVTGSAPPGTSGTLSSPIQVGGPTSSGWSRYVEFSQNNTAVAIKNDGSMWSWGSTQEGCLGQNETGSPTQPWFPSSSRLGNARSSPTQIPGTWGNVVADDTKPYLSKRWRGFTVLQKQ